jgi:hypothetical protein
MSRIWLRMLLCDPLWLEKDRMLGTSYRAAVRMVPLRSTKKWRLGDILFAP